MELEALQAGFIQAIFGGGREHMAAAVKSQGELDALQRVGIYRNSVHGNLCKYLASLYPVCEQLLGARFFEGLSDEFIDHAPPNSPFLGEYGADMAGFMRTHETMASVRWIAEMAVLEWMRHEAWNAVNQPVSNFSRLAELDAEQQGTVCFELPGSARLLQSEYALHAIWMAHQPEDYPDKLPLDQIELQQPVRLLVWRTGRRLSQAELDTGFMEFLRAVHSGLTLEALGEQFQEQLPVLLSTSIQRGWVVSFREVAPAQLPE